MMKRIVSVASLALLMLGGVALGNEKKPATFGALEALSAAEAQTKVAAWLKDVGKADAATTQQLTAIWKDSSRSILDRVADSLALGDPIAAKLMNEARDPHAPAPVVLPEVFKNEKTSAFFRANLALTYARALTNRGVYEEALDTLKLFSADQVADPASYLFHRAVCEHAMLRKSEATKTVMRLLEEGHAISPDRYTTVATLILLDMHTWKDKDLGDIARKMENIRRRLDIARGGPETQRQEREVLNRLDEMIKKLENQNKKKKKPGDGGGGGGDGDQECPDGQPGGSGPPKGVNPPTSPATDAGDPGGASTGKVDEKKFAKLVADWGRLPPREQQRALQEITLGMSPRHREAIENYFKSLTNPSLKR
jgi:hypothetical protein